MAGRNLERYRSSSQQALMRVLDALSGSPIDGMGLAQLQAALPELSQNAIYRAAVNAQLHGWAQPAPGGGWRVAPPLTLFSQRLRMALADIDRAYLGADR